jgi:hypothetical protein
MPTEVRGALELRKALRQFEPDLAKETSKEIANFLKPVVQKAGGFVPSNDAVPSGWLKRPNAKGRWASRYYDAAEVKRGIGYKTTPSKPNRNGWVSLASINNKGAAGAIYETAGRKSGITGNFTTNLPNANSLVGKGQKMRGRLIFKAYEENQGKARANVIKAIETAANKLNARSKA